MGDSALGEEMKLVALRLQIYTDAQSAQSLLHSPHGRAIGSALWTLSTSPLASSTRSKDNYSHIISAIPKVPLSSQTKFNQDSLTTPPIPIPPTIHASSSKFFFDTVTFTSSL
jgi:hypothetical protein